MVTLLVAVTSQLFFTVYFQVTNNEQQQAAINANVVALQELKSQVFSMQTPLSSHVIKMDAKIDEIVKVGQQRIMQLEHLIAQSDRLAERLILLDRRLLELEIRHKQDGARDQR